MNTPKTIFLQIAGVSGDATVSNLDQATWCDDRVYDDDIEYIRKSDHDAEIASLREQLDRTYRVLQRYQPAGSPPPGDLPFLAAWVLQTMADALKAAKEGADFHPRAAKLMQKKKNFIVVAEDEPYFMDVYSHIRFTERMKLLWTDEDESLYQRALDAHSAHFQVRDDRLR